MHHVNYYGLVPFQVIFPALSTRLEVIVTLRFKNGNERLFLDSIQVFVQTVKQDVEQLLRVLLILIIELLFELGDYTLEFEGRH